MRTALLLLILSFVLALQSPPVEAQELGSCNNPESEFYRPVFIDYQYRNARIMVRDLATGDDVETLETDLQVNDIILQWSPNCHYLLGYIGEVGYIIWNMTSGTRASSFPEARSRLRGIQWSPDNDYLIFPRKDVGTYIFQCGNWNVCRCAVNESIRSNQFPRSNSGESPSQITPLIVPPQNCVTISINSSIAVCTMS